MRFHSRGITLIELMVVVVVVAILAGIAVPSYRNYVLRAQRTDATSALLRIAAAQEKFYLQNNRYASTAELPLGPPAGLGIQGTEHGWYQLRIANPSGDPTLDFTATATAVTGGAQADDGDCASFSIDQQGQRGATDSAAANNVERCWR